MHGASVGWRVALRRIESLWDMPRNPEALDIALHGEREKSGCCMEVERTLTRNTVDPSSTRHHSLQVKREKGVA